MQQLTMLLLLLVWLQIYGNSVVLSLPPSLIANAASGIRHQHQVRQLQLQQQQQQLQQRAKEQLQQSGISTFNTNSLWKKDNNANYYDSLAVQAERALDAIGVGNDDFKGNNINSNNNNNNNKNSNNNDLLTKSRIISPSAMAMIASANRVSLNGGNIEVEDTAEDSIDLPPSTLLLSASSSSAPLQSQSQSPTPPVIAPRIREIEWNKFLTPLKYWARQCKPNVDDDCPQEYQRYQFQQQQQQQTAPLRIADNRNKATAAALSDSGDSDRDISAGLDDNSDIDATLYPNKDIFMLLHGQEDLMKFLHWAMEQLQPYERFKNFSLGNGDNIYITDKHWWKKLNLSGRREPPLFVEEPHYVIVRREPFNEDKWGFRFKDDPFIPPRGRKHNVADLEQLLTRYDPFVPNRGKRDRIKDIFKYDDLFIPNRGKKQNTVIAIPMLDDGDDGDDNDDAVPAFNADDADNDNEYGIAYNAAADYDDSDDDDDDDDDDDGDDDNDVDNDYKENSNRNDIDKWTLPPPPLQQAAPPLAKTETATLWPSKLWQQKNVAAVVNGKPALVVNINGGREHNHNNNNNYEKNDNNLAANDWSQRMSTNDVKINGYDQSVKTSMPTAATATATAMKIKIPKGEMSTMYDTKQQSQKQQKIQNRLRRIVNADGVAANRLHATRSMTTIERQQQQKQKQQSSLLIAAAKQWLKSTIFNMPHRQQQLHEKLKPKHHFHHHDEQQQQQQQQHKNEAVAATIRQHPVIMRYLKLLQRNVGRQLPPEMQLAALNIQQQQQRQLLPTTFIDGNDD